MLNHLQKTVFALVVLVSTSLPASAESIDVRVIGTITPPGCHPALSGGGTVDYGSINSKSLAADAYTVLPEKQLDFTITCDAPAKIALKAIEGRPNTAPGLNANGNLDVTTARIFGLTAGSEGVNGLGLDGTAKIGGYGIRLAAGTITADGVSVDSLSSSDMVTWSKTAVGSLHVANSPRYSTWAATGTTTPVAFTTLAGKLGVQAYINKASALDLTKPVLLDGLTTLELVYL
ncbi:DUF1120 domain-containing protein [Serratia aquatilis]|uniref:DUF1120 domain-containing protein n=1 Tax=Serratia aquatilis TaxID=1737515 RepID=A0ABV6E932_9GAMM